MNEIQTLRYKTGIWEVEASLQPIGRTQRLAIVRARAGEGRNAIESKHTVVYDHVPGNNELEETRAHAQRALMLNQ